MHLRCAMNFQPLLMTTIRDNICAWQTVID